MIKTSTLLYLFDDFSDPNDLLFPLDQEKSEDDYYLSSIMLLAEIDPGEDLVAKTIEKIKI